jgi:hypothetical protein
MFSGTSLDALLLPLPACVLSFVCCAPACLSRSVFPRPALPGTRTSSRSMQTGELISRVRCRRGTARHHRGAGRLWCRVRTAVRTRYYVCLFQTVFACNIIVLYVHVYPHALAARLLAVRPRDPLRGHRFSLGSLTGRWPTHQPRSTAPSPAAQT